MLLLHHARTRTTYGEGGYRVARSGSGRGPFGYQLEASLSGPTREMSPNYRRRARSRGQGWYHPWAVSWDAAGWRYRSYSYG